MIALSDVSTQGTFLPPLPQAVTSFGAAVTDAHLFVIGGYFGTPHAYSREGQSKDVWALDLKNPQEWQKVGGLTQGLQGLAASAYQGRACFFGGNHASNPEGTEAEMNSVTEARCFVGQTKTWSDLPPLPEGRSSHAATVIGETVYVVGGWRLSGSASSGAFAKDLLSLDLSDPEATWQSLPAPFQRRALGATQLDGKLVVVGGMSEKGEISSRVDVYDPATKEWTRGPDHPGDAFGVAIATVGDALYSSGREGILRRLEQGGNGWETVRTLAFPRFFHEMRGVSNELLVVGGIGGMHTRGRTRVVEKLPLDGSLSYGQLEFPWPGKTKNRQGILTQGAQIYLFGGNLSLGQHDFEPAHFSSEGWLFDLSTLKFRETTPFPLRRQSMQTLGTGQEGLAIGGFGHDPQSGDKTEAVSHDEVFGYSWEEQSWKALAKLPRGRTQFGLTESEELYFIFGGLNYDPQRKESFDHDRAIWTSAKEEVRFEPSDLQLPGPRRAFAGAALAGKYYLIGGMKEGFQLVDDCLAFDFSSRSFETIPCPAPRLSGDLVPAGDKLYLVGGSLKTPDGLQESRTVEVYDPQTNEWAQLSFQIPFSTRHMRAFSLRDHVVLLSTYHEEQTMTLGLLGP